MVNVGFVIFVMASVVISLRWSSQAIRQLYRLKSYDLLELERNIKEALDRVDNAIDVMIKKSEHKATDSIPAVESAMGSTMGKKDLYQEILSNLKKADSVNLSPSVGVAASGHSHQNATGQMARGQAVEKRRYEEAMVQRGNHNSNRYTNNSSHQSGHQSGNQSANNYNAIKERLARATEQAKREESWASGDQQALQRMNQQRAQQYDPRHAQPHEHRGTQRYGQDDRYSNVTPLNIVSGSRSPMPAIQREEEVASLLSSDRTVGRSNPPVEEGYRRAYLGR